MKGADSFIGRLCSGRLDASFRQHDVAMLIKILAIN
jgi:hypothetical protein